MNYSDILTLAKAGFTSEQISILARAEAAAQQQPAPAGSAPTPAPVQTQVQTPAPAPVNNTDPAKSIINNFFPMQAPAQAPTLATTPATAPAPSPTSTQAPAQAPAPDPVQNQQSTIDDVLKQLGIMQNAMQGQALAFAQQPKEQSVDDILAEIINPPVKDQKA